MDIDTTSNNSNNNSNNNTPHAAYTSVYHKDLYDKSLESLEVLDLLSDTNTIINHHIQNDDTMNTDIHAPTHTNSNTNNQHHQHHHHHHTHHTTCNNTNQNNHTSTSTSTSNDMTVSPSLSPSNEKKSVIGNNNTLDTVSTSSSSNSSSSGQNNHANNNNAHHHLHHLQDYFPSAGTMIHNSHSGMSSTEEEAVTSDNVHRLWKRKYQRHAKPDTNAPIKPPSAYVMFSNDIRSELKKENKSFTDLAKIIGDRWKNISVEEKERYEGIASKAREDFIRKTSEYQKTDLYKRYQKYIKDFKSEHEAAARPVGRPRKRQKGLTYCIDEETTDLDSIATNEVRSLSSEQRQYPYYLLNDDSSQRSTPIATVVTDKQT
ncbi:hypothetical protein BDB01DRAFT_788241 [Pilobolus umbonatus]|nr:hypothetical protein BDB01DRAFT_788241 [Pilobolus umbonatus]